MGIPLLGFLWLVMLFAFGACVVTVFMRVSIRVFQRIAQAFMAEPLKPGAASQVCPHPGCDRVNTPGAKYCGRCGRALQAPVDRYG